jgi:tetratricopeptide (TPR) repeat protein
MQGEAEWQRAAYGWIEDPESGVRRAEALARRALASPDPRSQARAQSLVASLRTHVGHPEEALDYTARALAINPSDTSSLFRRGHALLALGRIEEAIATIEEAMRFDPVAGLGPFAQLATAYYLAGRYRDTVALVDRATGMHERRGTMQAIRAAALAQLGEMEEARRSADAVRRFNPTHSVEEAGTRLRNPEHAAKLREGLAKAGL